MLLLTEVFPPALGGSAVLFEQIYSRVESADVTVLTRHQPGAAAEDRRGRMRLVADGEQPWTWGVMSGGYNRHWSRARALINQIGSGPALVHCGRVLPEGLTALVAQRIGGPPFVCWTHGEELAYIHKSREFSVLARLVYRSAAAVIANSQHTARMLMRAGVPSAKVVVIHPGVDTTRFSPGVSGEHVRQRFASPGELLLLSVGRLQRRKGHDVVITAMDVLRDRFPHLRYVIAGDGEERSYLQQIVASHRLTDRVSFAGAIPESDLPAFYSACDMFLMPNRVERGDLEGFGIVFLEASASGRPVIGGRSGGVPEAVEDGVTGLLVDGGSVEDVAAAIERLATSATLRTDLGHAGRERVLRSFTWQAAAHAVADLHERLTVRSARPRG
jgi:phosphatidylinositol alpha-1,6-mannosyltransferase